MVFATGETRGVFSKIPTLEDVAKTMQTNEENFQHHVLFKKKGQLAASHSWGHLHLTFNLHEIENMGIDLEEERKKLEKVAKEEYFQQFGKQAEKCFTAEIQTLLQNGFDTINDVQTLFVHEFEAEVKPEPEIITLSPEIPNSTTVTSSSKVLSRPKRFLATLGIIGSWVAGIFNAVEIHRIHAQIKQMNRRINLIAVTLKKDEVKIHNLEIQTYRLTETLEMFALQVDRKWRRDKLREAREDLMTQTMLWFNSVREFALGMETLTRNQLSYRLVETEVLKRSYNELVQQAEEKGLVPLRDGYGQLFREAVSVIVEEEGMLHVYVHIPFLKSPYLSLFTHIPVPVNLNEQWAIQVSSENTVLATDNDTISVSMKLAEVDEKCLQKDDVFFCPYSNVFELNSETDCLALLYQKRFQEAVRFCKIDFLPAKERILQIDSNQFVFSTPVEKTEMSEICTDTRRFSTLTSFTTFAVDAGCCVTTKSHSVCRETDFEAKETFMVIQNEFRVPNDPNFFQNLQLHLDGEWKNYSKPNPELEIVKHWDEIYLNENSTDLDLLPPFKFPDFGIGLNFWHYLYVAFGIIISVFVLGCAWKCGCCQLGFKFCKTLYPRKTNGQNRNKEVEKGAKIQGQLEDLRLEIPEQNKVFVPTPLATMEDSLEDKEVTNHLHSTLKNLHAKIEIESPSESPIFYQPSAPPISLCNPNELTFLHLSEDTSDKWSRQAPDLTYSYQKSKKKKSKT